MKLKDLLTYGLVGLLAFTMLFGGRNYQQKIDLGTALTEVSIKNEQLLADNISLSNSITTSDIRYAELDSAYQVADAEVKRIRKGKVKSDAKNAELIAELEKMSSDSSYNFLQDSVYISSIEPKSYGFDSVQVKAIHADYINRVHLEEVNSILEAEVVALVGKGATCDSMNIELKAQNEMFERLAKNYEKLYNNEKNTSKLYKESAKQSANRKTFWTIMTGVASGIAVIGLIL